MEHWKHQYFVDGNKTFVPLRPPQIRDIIDLKRKAVVTQNNAAFTDRGIGTMCDSIDTDALHKMSLSLWQDSDAEISLRYLKII